MSEPLTGAARALFEQANFVHLAVARKDGSILSVVLWADVDDGGNVIVNSAEGRAWPTNLRRSGKATVSVHNPQNPYEFASVECELAGDTHEGADATIDALAEKYMDVDEYPFRQPGEQRITFTLRPARITYRGT